MSEPLLKECPKCKQLTLQQILSGYEVVVRDGVIKCWGQQSAHNYKQMGKTKYEDMMGPELERQKAEDLGPLGVDLDNPRAIERYIYEGEK
jgi:hypothetical protein